MPAKYSIKQYVVDGYYHIFNRGVEKRDIFLDESDYRLFLSYLKNYLIEPLPEQVRPVRLSHLYDQIQLISYCLMPNHFHLVLKQKNIDAITRFMRCLSNAYTGYFNKKYDRVGVLFQGRFKGVLITEEPYLLHLTRYIHLNPQKIYRSDLQNYPYSSYSEYLKLRQTSWIHPEEILSFFKTAQNTKLIDLLSYQSFVEDYKENSSEILGELTLE